MSTAALRKQEIFEKAVGYISKQLAGSSSKRKVPVLYGPDNRPVRSASYGYKRNAAKKSGSMKNWIPSPYYNYYNEALERNDILARSIDLVNNDPHAAGVVDTFATTIVGPGLTPHPALNADVLGLTKEEIRSIQSQQKAVYNTWNIFADASQKQNFGGIQYVIIRNLMQYGEYLVLLPMINDPSRPYSLACQIINPQRLQTPSDLSNESNIIDGVEVGSYGEPVAYWIQKSSRELNGLYTVAAYSSKDYHRIPAKVGHRWNVLHGFIQQEPEQYRGLSMFAPAMKFFRDLNDYLDAELVSNIVTAAFSMFIELQGGSDPYAIANSALSMTGETVDTSDAIRYQELIPGQIMYGATGEKPHAISANRPGSTFEPFTKVIKKAIAMSLNIPYPVLFKDVESVNFAGFRSAMLDAWRVFMMRRTWLGQGFCSKVWTMLQEEAYLRGNLKVPQDFYGQMYALTQSEWRGSPKGDIEPIKAIQADIQAIQNNIKTRAEAIAERGGDIRTTFDQLAEEQEMMKERGLFEAPIVPQVNPDGMVDDMGEAGSGLDID